MQPINDALTGAPNLNLLPVERVVVRSVRGARQAWLSVTREPYAVVVRDGAGLRALGIDGEAKPLDALREMVPGLDELLR